MNSINTTVPTLAMRDGDFSGQPNSIFDPLTTPATRPRSHPRTSSPAIASRANRWDPVTAKLMNAYPAADQRRPHEQLSCQSESDRRTGTRAMCASIISSPRTTISSRAGRFNTPLPSAPHTFPAVQIPGLPKPVGLGNEDSFAGPAFNPTQHAVASYVKVISPRLVNDLRVGFNRFVLDYTGEGVRCRRSTRQSAGRP